ncbi:enoyl-CoA hydratase/isomerase family protein [Aspergillus clavatus NRRL 1]|uniref:Enoyl-CoA hydratase/isomerase family protein n=1 Tax=Aspergillus clavatus (strain ATCC 1007 / CBS 513.65 / DSM 816 / NCTC 3887 / NRRL 1 / QM 1276 / 107) TaxID=344612 RepID=A1CLF2_ASPCL|nr:enoyl-CoA hydratase/isomerase family protein [Aspergillus clavatus NRRL 1]EAW09976.1 enoyl-CoA hydratase/isomerase family protein [Aspergillus clavatus NRRL 1]
MAQFTYESVKYFSVRFPAEYQYVAHVEINRPDKMNAFFEAMWIEMGQLFDQLSQDPSVRAIVLSGAGDKAFTTGLDVTAASEGLLSDESNNGPLDPARKAVHFRRHIASFQDCITAVERCEKPVIVAMHGFSLGLAVDLSTAADVRVCARDTRFAVKEVDIGLAADIGTLSRLPKAVGNFGWVKEVALTARIFGAEEALRVGLVSSVYESKAAAVQGALAMGKLIASKSPVAVQGTKEILNYSRDHSVQDGLRYTAVWNSAALQTKDISAALLSGLKKRTPTFEKL